MYVINKYLPTYLPTYPQSHHGLVLTYPPKHYTFTHMHKVYMPIYILHMIYVGNGDSTLVFLVPHQCLDHQTITPFYKTI
jgi:hypothetical protein